MFHVGDIVTTVKPDDCYQEPTWTPEMDEFISGIVIGEPDEENEWYQVRFTEPCGNWFYYREEWLESAETQFSENHTELDALFEEICRQ